MNLVSVIETFIDNSSSRVVKFFKMGKNVHSAKQAGPFGFDSNPIAGMVAIHVMSSVDGKPVIVGYINKNQVVGVGESRMFSTNATGTLQIYIKCTSTGDIQLGGTTNHAVRWESLNDDMEDLEDDINTELEKIRVAIAGLGGTYSKSAIGININGAKSDKVFVQ